LQRIPPFKTLDVFRGFAAIWVVMVHSCDRWLSDGNLAYLHVPLYAFSIRGQLGVVLFFVISGYCITAAAYSALISGKSIWRYSYERVRRIYPPYLVALVFTVVTALVIGFANNHHLIGEVHHLQTFPPSAKFWIANLLLLQSEFNTPMVNVVFWSLCYEVAFYFVIGVFLKIGQWIATKRSLRAGTVFFVSAVGVSSALALVSLIVYSGAIFPFDLWSQFAIGGLLFFLLELKPETVSGYTKGFRWMVLANVLLVVGLTVAFGVLRQVGEVDIGHPSSKVRSAFCLLFCLLLMALRPIDAKLAENKILKPLMWVGAFSYSLYLTHPVVLPFVDILCRKVGLNGPRYWIAFWIQVAVAIVFGRIFYVLVEKHFISKRQVQRLVAEHVV
jgi:peptidoglycan/LPS O-acetylase OafA/YrhL